MQENLQQLEQDCYSLENMARKVPPSRREESKGCVTGGGVEGELGGEEEGEGKRE